MHDEKNDNQKKGILKSTLPNLGDVYHGVLDKSNDFDLTEEDMEEIAKLYDLATPEEVKEGLVYKGIKLTDLIPDPNWFLLVERNNQKSDISEPETLVRETSGKRPSKKRNVDWSNDFDDLDGDDWEGHYDPYTGTRDRE